MRAPAAISMAIALMPVLAVPACAEGGGGGAERWWLWPVLLFLASFALGTVAIVGGIGGGTIFVPVVSGFFPFHLDYVRAAGLLVALAGALAAGPQLLRQNLADLRLAMPVALVASTAAIAGARIGLALPAPVVQVALGVLVLIVFAVVAAGKSALAPAGHASDPLARALGLGASYWDPALAARIEWRVHRTWTGLGLFVLVGLMAGMFGIGAGWANVPVLNLVMGVPLKIAVGTSGVLLAVTDTSAAWIYIHQGAVLPLVVVPSVLGMMLGARIGVRILVAVRPEVVRRVVLVVLAFAGIRTLLRGLGVW